MRDYLKYSALLFLAVLGALVIIGFIGSWSAPILFLLALLGLPLIATLGLGIGLLLIVRGVKFVRTGDLSLRNRVVAVLIVPILLSIAAVCSLPALWLGSFTGMWVKFLTNYSRYEAIIAKAEVDKSDGQYSEYLTDDGVTYVIDYGPPIRVAFNPEGILDNWAGIIFDPTGEVMRADGFDPVTGAFHASDSVTKLFGGDLISCHHMWDSYYKCSFT
ncbi:MAG: hypothetical protein JJE34_00295 [Alphaproteobacteria bacterium]|nr:hypothetical protein [Alphaproteobacteria bacterium]